MFPPFICAFVKFTFLIISNPAPTSPPSRINVNNSYFLKTAINAKRTHNGLSEIDAMEFLKLVKEETGKFNIDRKLLQRDLNSGFSGGRKKEMN